MKIKKYWSKFKMKKYKQKNKMKKKYKIQKKREIIQKLISNNR